MELISFDSPINFKLDEMRQVAIEGDAIFGEVAAFPMGPVPQTQKPRTTPRKMILFKAAQDFSIKSAEFVNVNGNAYGLSSSRLSASKFQGEIFIYLPENTLKPVYHLQVVEVLSLPFLSTCCDIR